MNYQLRFHIPPVAKGRGRVGRGGNVYTPGRTRAFENAIKTLARRQWPLAPLEGPLAVVMRFFMPVPKRLTRMYPTGRPDLDNLQKAVWDSCNGIVWSDDSQIVKVSAEKLYDVVGGQSGILLSVSSAEELRGDA